MMAPTKEKMKNNNSDDSNDNCDDDFDKDDNYMMMVIIVKMMIMMINMTLEGANLSYLWFTHCSVNCLQDASSRGDHTLQESHTN